MARDGPLQRNKCPDETALRLGASIGGLSRQRKFDQGGKFNEMPCHQNAAGLYRRIRERAQLADAGRVPLFRPSRLAPMAVGRRVSTASGSTASTPGRWFGGGRRRPAYRRLSCWGRSGNASKTAALPLASAHLTSRSSSRANNWTCSARRSE